MNEPKFKEYLNKEISAEQFLQSWPKHPLGINNNVSSDVIALESDFEIKTKHLIMLCDDVLCNNLTVANLSAIAYSLIFSNWFTWENDLLDKAIYSWNNAELNNLTIDHIKYWKELLTNETTD